MFYKQQPAWRKSHSFFLNSAPKNLQSWLTDRDSLTRRLILVCESQNVKFQVRVYHEAWERPQFNESKLLNMKINELGFVRQVHLFCGEKPWVYARTVIPQSTLHGELQKLTSLGSQSLGVVLFSNKHINRSNIEIAKLNSNQQMYSSAIEKSLSESSEIWGRRSIFTIGNKPLLVSEVFLPDLI